MFLSPVEQFLIYQNFTLFNPVETSTCFLISSLSTSASKAMMSTLAAKLDAATPVASSNSFYWYNMTGLILC